MKIIEMALSYAAYCNYITCVNLSTNLRHAYKLSAVYYNYLLVASYLVISITLLITVISDLGFGSCEMHIP